MLIHEAMFLQVQLSLVVLVGLHRSRFGRDELGEARECLPASAGELTATQNTSQGAHLFFSTSSSSLSIKYA